MSLRSTSSYPSQAGNKNAGKCLAVVVSRLLVVKCYNLFGSGYAGLGFRKLKISLAYVIIPIISLLIWMSLTYAEHKMGGETLVGGPCEYKLYAGRAKIISISQAIESAGSSKKKYEVKFSFTPNLKIEESFAQTEGREYPLLLKNNSYPDQAFLEKYGIEVGKVFDCILMVIVRGTCTPILFDFPTIKLDDYSEN